MSQEIEPEEWRPVSGWEGLYEVSSLGRVRSVSRVITTYDRAGVPSCRLFVGTVLAPQHAGDGYGRISMLNRGAQRSALVHCLVAEAFLGSRPPGHDVAHNDGNPANPRLSNLRYATRKENMADTVQHGTKRAGETHQCAKITSAQAAEIRAASGTQRVIAAQFGISSSLVGFIRAGKRWNIPGHT